MAWSSKTSTSSRGKCITSIAGAGRAGEFFTDRPGAETGLRYLDGVTGRSTTVAENLGVVSFGLSASRDGRSVFFSRVDASVDELMVVDDVR